MSAPIGVPAATSAQHGQAQDHFVDRRGGPHGLRLGLRPAEADAARPARQAFDRAGLLEDVEVVLRGADAPESQGLGDLGLRGRHALGLDAPGDQVEDGLLGIAEDRGHG
jgi:hypothetical protein